MSKSNVKPPSPNTHEGGKAKRIKPIYALRRSVLSCLLWEREFYEDGEDIAQRISGLAAEVDAHSLAQLAWEARHQHKLRHVPLLLLSALATHHRDEPKIVRDAIAQTLDRADEPGEFLALHARLSGTDTGNVKSVLSKSIKNGVGRAFRKFDAYQLGKYRGRRSGISLRDILRLTHPKPKDDAQAALWKSVIDDTLPSPDTWEVALSGGADKRETFERLLAERRLGYLALLRNLRNMVEAGVDDAMIRQAIVARNGGAHRVLPFRFIAAARAMPQFESELDEAMLENIDENQTKMLGMTLVLVDVSGSMFNSLSAKSDLTRMDAAASLACIVPCERKRLFTFSNQLVEVPPRQGMAGVDAIVRSQRNLGTHIHEPVAKLNTLPHDRLIVITDEQTFDSPPDPVARQAYMINVASYQHGIGYGAWTHLDGFSENVLRFICEIEFQDKHEEAVA